MQYSTILSLLAATGAMAAPHSRRQTDTSIRVLLSDGAGLDAEVGIAAAGDGSSLSFSGFSNIPNPTGPFTTVELLVGADFANQALRCQIQDEAGVPIVVTRGQNVDITFSDAGNGEWTLPATTVNRVICNNDLVQAAPEDLRLTVTLTDSGSDNEVVVALPSGSRQVLDLGAQTGVFDSLELSTGSQVANQGYRCQAVDISGNPVIVLRGQNRDITFSDGGNGAWTFEGVNGGGFVGITSIICDPTFVSGTAP